MAVPTFKEDELGKRWDRCLADAVIKLGGGLVLGAVSSLLLFKRRSWPVVLGTGFGIGLAYGHCERDIAAVLSVSHNHVRPVYSFTHTDKYAELGYLESGDPKTCISVENRKLKFFTIAILFLTMYFIYRLLRIRHKFYNL